MEKQVIGSPFLGELKALYLSPARRTVEQCYHALKRKYKANGLAVPPLTAARKMIDAIPEQVIALTRG
ncbi:hypothetical protein HF882_22460 [Victivallis vadensis]|uniref:Mu DNA binding I gamma subdomain domain-containing protein n=1 Tax=Victivallis vadensis TaxID=172901 RepID=A0A848B8J7_9BACT|nr:DNA-binding domain-containing protein [Victivallis vadensis]NMD89352.1 hypothetical protein [Victivallis vadensis]